MIFRDRTGGPNTTDDPLTATQQDPGASAPGSLLRNVCTLRDRSVLQHAGYDPRYNALAQLGGAGRYGRGIDRPVGRCASLCGFRSRIRSLLARTRARLGAYSSIGPVSGGSPIVRFAPCDFARFTTRRIKHATHCCWDAPPCIDPWRPAIRSSARLCSAQTHS